MNNKGFAISGIIYGVLIVFLLLVFSVLGILINRKISLDKIKNDAMNTVLGNYGESLEMPSSLIIDFNTISINSNVVEYMKTFDYTSLVYSPYGYIIIASTTFNYAVGTSGTITFSSYNGSNLITSVDKTIKVVDNTLVDNYEYTGGVQTKKYGKGLYKLEVWGSSAGDYNYYAKGGYSSGIYRSSNEQLYIYVGGSGMAGKGGFNGGGGAGPLGYGGGGATDIRIGEDSLYSRVIVAGGAGGKCQYSSTYISSMYGGGTTAGGAYVYSSFGTTGAGATQTKGGAGGFYSTDIGVSGTFGAGGTALDASSDGGGGGGGFYGGGSGSSGSSISNHGGGGSGFVWTAETSSYVPSNYTLLTSQYLLDAKTINGNTAFPNITGSATETGHVGNGYAKITQLVTFE